MESIGRDFCQVVTTGWFYVDTLLNIARLHITKRKCDYTIEFYQYMDNEYKKQRSWGFYS